MMLSRSSGSTFRPERGAPPEPSGNPFRSPGPRPAAARDARSGHGGRRPGARSRPARNGCRSIHGVDLRPQSCRTRCSPGRPCAAPCGRARICPFRAFRLDLYRRNGPSARDRRRGLPRPRRCRRSRTSRTRLATGRRNKTRGRMARRAYRPRGKRCCGRPGCCRPVMTPQRSSVPQ